MAQTLEFYKSRGRGPRYSTKLSTFANGMYLTKQLIPEGYAKALVNYDIDDTGSCIRPRRGRQTVQSFDYTSPSLGPVSITDYIYSYNPDRTEVEDIKDVVMSYGDYKTLSQLFPNADIPDTFKEPIFIAYATQHIDTTVYDDDGSIITPGDLTTITHENSWTLYCDKGNEDFNKVTNEDLGYMTARTILNAYAFDKTFKEPVGRPVSTILSNELIAFTGAKIVYDEYPSNTDKNTFPSLTTPSLTKVQLVHNANDTYSMVRKMLDPKQLNVTEASTGGYNILHAAPYVFTDVQGGSLNILGMLLYNTQSDQLPIFVPSIGEKVSMRIYYQYPTVTNTLKYKVEYMNNTISDADWQVLQDWTSAGSTGVNLWYDFVPNDAQFLVRVTIRLADQTNTEYPMTKAFDTTEYKYKNLQNKAFNLGTAKGMISWQGCVGVYGVDNAKDTIFFSDVEDPSYFPFPNNIIPFDNEILAVHNYLDFLLVVTTDSIWLVTGGGTIKASITKRIMSNIFIPEIDAINLIVLKDQIFFKTDTQFYVLKPNTYTADSTNLKNYTNSTAVANYTNNFTEETLKLLNKVFKPIWHKVSKEARQPLRFDSFEVLDTKSITRNEEVHYVYTITPYIEDRTFGNLNLHLVYNSMTRSWRIYFKPIGDDTVYHSPLLYRNKQSGSFYEFFPHSYNGDSKLTVVKQSYDLMDDNIKHDDWELTKDYNNFTYIDTGDPSIDDITLKRFRELQINLVNIEKTEIGFYADFFVDGNEKVHATNYEVLQITDPADPEYGIIYVVPYADDTLTTGFVVDSETILSNIDSTDLWKIDLGAFPELTTTTIRLELQGKGRRGSVQLLNTSLKRYEIADWVWVYRVMMVR